MNKTILVATDFSAASLHAADYAADIALAIDADICLLHTYEITISYAEVIVFMDEMMSDVGNQLNNVKEMLFKRNYGKTRIITKIVRGTFFEQLSKTCESIKPYAVVMGSQGLSASQRFFFGSHTVYALQHLTWPLITVPKAAEFTAIRKIGLACDFENIIDTVPVEVIKMLLHDFSAELEVLNTGKVNEYRPETVFGATLLRKIFGAIKYTYHFIIDEKADEPVMDFAEKNNIDLLIVLPKRHSLLDKLIHKSHSKHFVLFSKIPVMALHH
jgi:nucleotide-binding universal stress UspA family protein